MGSTGLRERKKQQTRDELIDVALELFEARGFDAVTIDEIAAAADVSPRTFYRYFGSKEAVLYPEGDELLEALRHAIEAQAPEVPPLQVLREAVAALARRTATDRGRQLRRARLVRDGAELWTHQRTVLQPQWEEVLAEALGAHLGVEVDVDLRPRLLAGVGVAVMTAVGTRWTTSEGTEDLDALIDDAFDALAGAAGLPPGGGRVTV